MSSPSPFRPDPLNLSAVSCADATTCFAVGKRNRDDSLDYGSGIVIEQWNGSTWSTVVGPAVGGSLSAVSCPTATRCVAVGSQDPGTLIEQWDGTSWSRVASPDPNGTNAELNGVSCWSVNLCTAVGDWRSGSNTRTLVERWDGVGWQIDASPDPAGAFLASLSAVSCPNVTSCFAVGTHQESGDYPYKGGALLEHWNGTAWKIQPSPTPTWHGYDPLLIVPLLDGISCPTPRSCTAVGYTPLDALVEHWNGTTWSLVASPHPAPQGTLATIATLRAVDCAAANNCMAVGVTFVPIDYREGAPAVNSIAEHWNGKAWAIVARPRTVLTTVNYFFTGELSALSGVSCPAANQCAAVGNSAMAEQWNGATWSLAPLVASTSYSSLQSIACPSATTCFAVGNAAPLLDAADNALIEQWNGTTWSAVPTPSIAGTNVSAGLNSVSCVSAADCTAVGGYSAGGSVSSTPVLIEHWNGAKWSLVASPAPSKSWSEAALESVACSNATDCNAVGLYSTSDPKRGYLEHGLAEHWNGTKWSIAALPRSAQAVMNGIACPSPTSCVAVGLSFTSTPGGGPPSPQTPAVDHWDGAHWTAISSPPPSSGTVYTLNSVSCPSTTDCTAVGEATQTDKVGAVTLIEHWNGTGWSITPSPTPTNGDVYLSMYGVSCTSATSCTAVGAIDEFGHGQPNPIQSPEATSFVEQWDGTTWTVTAAATAVPPMTGTSLFGVTCSNQTGCIAVGAGWGGIASFANNLYTDFTENSYTLVEQDV